MQNRRAEVLTGRWVLRGLVKRFLDRPIFGSGDIWTVEDIFAMLDSTGVHAVSVARGCIGNPWIFKQARRPRLAKHPRPDATEQRDAPLNHFNWQWPCMANERITNDAEVRHVFCASR